MSEATSLIRKHIMDPTQKIMPGNIAMVTLVQGLDSEKVCRRRYRCDGTFALPIDSGRVVGMTGSCAFTHIKCVYYGVVVDHTASQLEI